MYKFIASRRFLTAAKSLIDKFSSFFKYVLLHQTWFNSTSQDIVVGRAADIEGALVVGLDHLVVDDVGAA